MHYYSRENIRKIEAGVPSLETLMLKAGQGVFEAIQTYFPKARSLLLVLGKGNNAGDVISMLKHLPADYHVHCAEFLDEMDRASIPMINQSILNLKWFCYPSEVDMEQYDLIIDGGLGIGSSRVLTGKALQWIKLINASNVPVLSVDIPSGLCPNTGHPLGNAIVADVTVTFIAKKIGSVLGSGMQYVGIQSVNNLGIDLSNYSYDLEEFDPHQACWSSIQRPKDAYKGSSGKTLVIAGDKGYLGACLLAATSALKSGSGYVKVISHSQHHNLIPTYCPDLVALPDDEKTLVKSLEWADAVVIGPGLGRSKWSKMMYDQTLKHIKETPLIVDADGLYAFKKVKPSSPLHTVITPHVGEAAYLLNKKAYEVQNDRMGAIDELFDHFGCFCLLKGACTLVKSHKSLKVNPWSNPAMAKAGMGDVLAGMLVAFIARSKDIQTGIELAIALQSYSGEHLAKKLSYGLTASDVVNELPRYLSEIQKNP